MLLDGVAGHPDDIGCANGDTRQPRGGSGELGELHRDGRNPGEGETRGPHSRSDQKGVGRLVSLADQYQSKEDAQDGIGQPRHDEGGSERRHAADQTRPHQLGSPGLFLRSRVSGDHENAHEYSHENDVEPIDPGEQPGEGEIVQPVTRASEYCHDSLGEKASSRFGEAFLATEQDWEGRREVDAHERDPQHPGRKLHSVTTKIEPQQAGGAGVRGYRTRCRGHDSSTVSGASP